MKAVVAFLLGAASANELAWKDAIQKDWTNVDHVSAFKNWKTEFGKVYADLEEESSRFLQFLDNWEKINKHNMGNYTWELGMNQFGDLSLEEFQYQVHGHSGSCLTAKSPEPVFKWDGVTKLTMSDNLNIADEVDWTSVNGKSYVSAVKNQGSCGSCWAFSATGALESRHAIKNGVTDDAIVTLSEQELIDCSKAEGNQGCNGGLMDDAFEYVEKEGGLCSEKEYPYEAKTERICRASRCGTKYDAISGYKDVKADSMTDLAAAVAEGPVSIAVDAAGTTWQFYKKGIVESRCGTSLDHGVLAVGYGTDGSSEFWKVKNSWGASWGEEGYIRLCKDCGERKGECGILEQPSYPIMK